MAKNDSTPNPKKGKWLKLQVLRAWREQPRWAHFNPRWLAEVKAFELESRVQYLNGPHPRSSESY